MHGRSAENGARTVATYVEIYPQTDLFNLANHHLQIIDQKESEGEASGLAMDCEACLLALGVTLEAIINHAAVKAMPQWKPEKRKEGEQKQVDSDYEQKLQVLCKTLGIKLDYGQKPFQSLRIVRRVRNAMAHAYPQIGEKEVKPGKAIQSVMKTSWDQYAEPKKTREIFQDISTFEGMIYRALGMEYPPATCASGWVADGQR